MMHLLVLLPLLGCARSHLDVERCSCEGPPAHGASRCDGGECGPCMCLALAPVEPDEEFLTTVAVGPGEAIDWDEIDESLQEGSVRVEFAPGMYPDRLDVLRTDIGPHRLLLDGGDHGAIVPGIHTTYDDVPRSRVTVRGFEVTDSGDKGIYWRAGDDVVIENNVVHDNRGSPALSLDYANRSGLPSSSFVVRNNHVFNQRGECIYIGGSEGEDADAHERVEIVNNLVHNCWNAWDNKHDAINVKDRIAELVVARNVVFETHWGIEVASAGLIEGNLVFGTESNGFHLNDQWGSGLSGMVLRNNAVLRAGEHGARVGADRLGAEDVLFEGLTVQGSSDAAIAWAGMEGVSGRLDRVVLAGNAVGLEGWGSVELEVDDCELHGNETDDEGVGGAASACDHARPDFGDLDAPAGPDGFFFTEDDPWLVHGGAQLR